MSEIKVNSIKGVAASTAALTINNTDGTCTANITNNLSNRNLLINGAMQVAQRGTSSTSSGYHTVDRFSVEEGGVDEAGTKEQAAVTSGGAYDSGFRNCLKITNGNQTGGAGASDYVQIMQRVEAQNMANSGWNFPSSSSFITLSFWIKSSVAQVFSGSLRTVDGTAYSYKYDTPSISANTWTKVTKTIPGNSNLTFADDNGHGFDVFIYPFIGTTYTTSNANTETWITAATNTYANDVASTWYTTNDATFEVTGVQLEVGSVATDFEHRSFAQELALCQRYYYTTRGGNSGNPNSDFAGFFGTPLNTGAGGYGIARFPVAMRATPTIVLYDATATAGKFTQNGVNYFTGSAGNINNNGFSLISGASGLSTSTSYTLTAGFTASAEL
jgi:hypothetical protein